MTPAASPPSARERRFGELLLRRAMGDAEEMQSARSTCRVLAPFYRRGDRVLDAGCGAGHYLRSLRHRIDSGVDYVGIDRSSHFIGLAHRAFPELGADRLRVADVSALPFADAAFDIVICANVVPNLEPPPVRAFAELLRVSRRVLIVRALFGAIDYVIREFADAESPEALGGDGGTYNNIYTEATYRALLAAAGDVIDVRIEPDADWQPFDSQPEIGSYGTRGDGSRQIAGQLVLDWRFIIVTRRADA